MKERKKNGMTSTRLKAVRRSRKTSSTKRKRHDSKFKQTLRVMETLKVMKDNKIRDHVKEQKEKKADIKQMKNKGNKRV